MSTHVALVLDESSSMGSVLQETVSGFNEYIDELRKDSEEIDFRVTLIKFSSTVQTVFKGSKLDEVPALDLMNYSPNGMTALYDGIGRAITQIVPNVAPADTALVVVLTDGFENMSREYNQQSILALIKKYEALGNWTFVYLGADQDAWGVSKNIGFQVGNTMSYASADTSGTYSKLASSTKTRGMMSTAAVTGSPLRSTATFFADDDEATGKGNE